jgi:hypothetical protein
MTGIPEQRRATRLTVPRHLIGPDLELRLVRLVNLSPEGGDIEHSEPLNEGVVCFVDLPPDLGSVRLTGRVVWTRPHEDEQALASDRPGSYHSALAWTGVTPAQQRTLSAAVEHLRAERDAPESEPTG